MAREHYWEEPTKDMQTLHAATERGHDRIVGWVIVKPGSQYALWSAVLNDGSPWGRTLARNLSLAAATQTVEQYI